jgi:hypothetical protein
LQDKYQPTEAEIQLVLKKAGWDARKLAIAYLKSQRRARGQRARADILDALHDMKDILDEAKKGGAGQ